MSACNLYNLTTEVDKNDNYIERYVKVDSIVSINAIHSMKLSVHKYLVQSRLTNWKKFVIFFREIFFLRGA